MTDSSSPAPDPATETPAPAPELLERPEVIDASDHDDRSEETIDHPAKVMRIGTMMKQLLEELRATELDEPSRDRLRDIYDTSVSELGSALSPDLREELGRLALPFGTGELPTPAELQVAKAQLVGWLEGLVQGMQAMLFAQQMAAQQQLQSMRGQIGRGAEQAPTEDRPGTYL